MSIQDVLYKLQQGLKAPKDKNNSFGNYKYRSAEGILEAVKPMLPEGVILTMSDDVVNIGNHNYIRATCSLTGEDGGIAVEAVAREAVTKKGMDDAQITGSASSYARKYALNGMFAIDDSKDADTDEYKKEVDNTPEEVKHSDEDKWLVKDLRWLIRECDNQVDLNSLMDELDTKIEGLHEDLQSDVYEAQDEVMGLIENGAYVQDNKYVFNGVTHGAKYGGKAKNEIESASDTKKLADWFMRWQGKLSALDTVLSAAKYQTDEGSPYIRIQNLYNKKIEALAKGDKNE